MPYTSLGTKVRALCVVVFAVMICSLLARGFATAAIPPWAYYVSPSGNDAAAGTSPSTAWRTLARASSADLKPGLSLLLQAGSRFTGQLKIGPHDGGNPSRPVHVASYGDGRATIAPDGESGLVVYDTGGVDISNLVISGHAALRSSTGGVVLFSTLRSGPAPESVNISGVDISGFGKGIMINPEHDVGFRDVSVRDALLHGNLDAGFATSGPPLNPAAPVYANENIRITRVASYDNRGDPQNTTSNSGNGIMLVSVKNATVAWSVAHDNGGRGGAAHEGPVGIWAYDSTGVIIEHNLSYDNTSASVPDGGGFDLDGGTSNSFLQYNLSYGNHGAGYMLYGPPAGPSQTGNVVRFNISSGDCLGQVSPEGSVLISGLVSHAAIYQNTVVTATSSAGPHAALVLLWPQLTSILVANNIFVTEQPAPVAWAPEPFTVGQVIMQGNNYYSAGGPWTIAWGGSSYLSLAAWQAGTGQEQYPGRLTGTVINPGLIGPIDELTAHDPGDPTNGLGFMLSPHSTLVGAGLDLPEMFGQQPGAITYSGLPASPGAPNVGAQ